MEITIVKKSDYLALEDLKSKYSIECRTTLELKITALATLNRTSEDLENINSSLQAYKEKVLDDKDAQQENLLFHLAIARACGNPTLNKSYLFSAVDFLSCTKKYTQNNKNLPYQTIGYYEAIFEAIISQNKSLAEKSMTEYLLALYGTHFIS